VSTPLEISEIVDRPGDVRVFSHERRAGIAEVTSSGRVRLDTIARWAQDVAWADVQDAGLQELTLWLVRRTTIRVNRFPRIDESHTVATYVTGIGRMWAERRTDIGQAGAAVPDVQVACIWVHLDPERRLPTPIHQIELDTWTGASTRQVKARLLHPAPPPQAAEGSWTFRAAELDLAEHINNAAFWTPLDDELVAADGLEPTAVEAEIEYRSPAQPGSKRLLSDGDLRWLLDPVDASEVHTSMVLRVAGD
jgi:acyl-ACP thioesterase